MQVPACGPAPVARDPGSPRSAGSDETSHTSLVHPAALSLQTSPLLSSSPALDTLATVGGGAAGSGSMSCSAVLPDAAQAARTLELPGGGTVHLPSGAPPALRQMFDTPGGSRALQLAARSLLRNNPILNHPGLRASTPRRPAPPPHADPHRACTNVRNPLPPAGAPCHALLTGLANMQQQQRSGAGPLSPLAPPMLSKRPPPRRPPLSRAVRRRGRRSEGATRRARRSRCSPRSSSAPRRPRAVDASESRLGPRFP